MDPNYFDDYFEAYNGVATELNGDLNLGRVFLQGTDQNDVTISVTSGEATVKGGASSSSYRWYPSIGHYSVVYNGERYLFLVNSDSNSVSATVSGLPNGTMDDLFDGGTQSVSSNQFNITMPAYDVKGYGFQ